EQFGGAIFVDSEPGSGSTFSIYWPGAGPAVVDATASLPVEAPALGSETILLIEDEAPLRTMVQTALGRAGYRVIAASGGEEALRLARSLAEPVDLVLSDVVMPGLKGPEVVARLCDVIPVPRALYMSGYADNALEYFQDKNVPFVAKPFSIDQLLRKVRELLGAAAAPPPTPPPDVVMRDSG
ncbi:MAG: response regulator, partial [Bryobacteraceae bacterium]